MTHTVSPARSLLIGVAAFVCTALAIAGRAGLVA